ncbi:MAG TPA: prepilin-type N-terminal cleavage/methylation domain-containing protein [Verrucomicrobiae bacterium]|nr:prepilin-type N-terminal cleavage/methylation domain-containing protein [Verrucomicrobiae bacterium]
MRILTQPAFAARRGFTLIECLAYIAVLGVLMSVGSFTVSKAWDQSRLLNRNAQDIGQTLRTGERWRAEIRAATGIVVTDSSPTNKLVRLTTRTGPVDYQFAAGEIRRRAGTNAPWVTVLSRVQTSAMQRIERESVTGWRWELELAPLEKHGRLRPLFTFTAVPGKEMTP